MQLRTKGKLLLAAGAVICVVALAWHLWLRESVERQRTLSRVIPEKEAQLREVRQKAAELHRLDAAMRRAREAASAAKKGFSPLSFLAQNARECGLNLTNIKPSTAIINETYAQSLAEMRIEAAKLDQLTNFLAKIETAKEPIFVQTLQISLGRDPSLLDAVITTSSFVPNPSASAATGRAK